MGGAFLGERERQAESVSLGGLQRAGNILGDHGMIGRERAVASSRFDPRSVQGCRLGTGVHGDGGAILRGEPQLIEGVNSDQLVARWHPCRERVHADAHLLVGGGLREPIGRKVLLEGRRGTV